MASRLGSCPSQDGGASGPIAAPHLGRLPEAETAIGDSGASGSVARGRDGSTPSHPARRGLEAFSQMRMVRAREAAATDSLSRTQKAGCTQRLPRLAGKSLAKELVFTGRRVGGKDAKSMGLVNQSVASGEAHLKALEIARDINQKGPLVLKMAKRAIIKGLELDMVSAIELEENCYEQLLNTKDCWEGLAAFAEKRKPKYTGQ